jgi:hypothetical protein
LGDGRERRLALAAEIGAQIATDVAGQLSLSNHDFGGKLAPET